MKKRILGFVLLALIIVIILIFLNHREKTSYENGNLSNMGLVNQNKRSGLL